MRALPGIHVLAEDPDFIATVFVTRDSAGAVAHVTRKADLILRLPASLVADLRASGWIAAETSAAALVHGPRNVAERDVAWRLLRAACDHASVVKAGTTPAQADTTSAPHLTPPPAPVAATATI